MRKLDSSVQPVSVMMSDAVVCRHGYPHQLQQRLEIAGADAAAVSALRAAGGGRALRPGVSFRSEHRVRPGAVDRPLATGMSTAINGNGSGAGEANGDSLPFPFQFRACARDHPTSVPASQRTATLHAQDMLCRGILQVVAVAQAAMPDSGFARAVIWAKRVDETAGRFGIPEVSSAPCLPQKAPQVP